MATVKGKRLIYVGPADGAEHKPLTIEGKAIGGTIAPGFLVKQVATGMSTSTTASTVFGEPLLIANIDTQRSLTTDDVWAQNQNVVAIQPRSGEFVNAMVVTGSNITTRGMALTRNGAGKLKIAATDGSDEILAYSDEIVNLAADALVRVRIA
jgi:hypothetical protein